MTRPFIAGATLAGVLLIVGCDSRTALSLIDSRVSGDGLPLASDRGGDRGRPADAAVDARRIGDVVTAAEGAGGPTREFVIDELLLPVTAAQAQQFGKDLNGDGKVDNALANILGTISTFGFGMNPQQSLTLSIVKGDLLHLVRLQAPDFVNATAAVGTTWRAKAEVCCTSNGDVTACTAEAKKTCFDGTYTFQPDPASPTPVVSSGTIKAAEIAFGPSTLKMTIPVLGNPVPLTLKQGYIGGQLGTSPQQITGGVIAGAIPQSEIDTYLVPAISGELDKLLKDPTGDPTAKFLVGLLFDADHDGTITAAEVASNGTVKPLITGDVDVDGDGVKELSMGIGFSAVGAVIDAP
jgi:hypothetical protein